MKKINFLFAVAAIVCAMGFVSCEGQENGENNNGNNNNGGGNGGNDTEAVAVKLSSGVNYGNMFNHYSNLVRLIVTTDSVNYNIRTGKVTGTGKYYTIDIMAEVGDKSFPKAGEYKVPEAGALEVPAGSLRPEMIENGMALVSFTDGTNAYGCYEYEVKDGKVTNTMVATKGSVKIAGDATKCTLSFSFDLTDGKDATGSANCKFEGAAPAISDKAVDASKYFESEAADPQTEFVFNQQSVTAIAGANGTDMEMYEIYLYGDNNLFGLIGVYIAPGENKYIKYDVTHEVRSGAAPRTKGAREENGKLMVGAPYIGIKGASGGLEKVWFIDGGTLDVKENGITFDLVTYKGTTIKAKYTGPVTFDPMAMPAPALTSECVAE